ncbi:hypothetical protein KIPB_016670, partial [Kipferlia bialata]
YTVVDSFFVGLYTGTEGLSALSLTAPLESLFPEAIGVMLGSGACSMLAVQIGIKHMSAARSLMAHLLLMGLFV